MKRLVIASSVALVLLVLAAVLLMFGGIRFMQASSRRALTGGISIGMTRSQVIEIKGQPSRTAHSPEEAQQPSHYYPAPSTPVEKEVLQYYDFIWRMNVYIGHDGRVTHIHLART